MINPKDIIEIISDSKSDNAEIKIQEENSDVVGDWKICLEDIK